MIQVEDVKFQSTLPRGSDSNKVAFDQGYYISIHAPSRERRAISSITVFTAQFQSTLPRGSDHACATMMACRWHFNPRSLAGATTNAAEVQAYLTISIHAPSRERPCSGYAAETEQAFQSTLPRGSDRGAGQMHGSRQNFNPRSLAGATEGGRRIMLLSIISIHAPSRERLLAYLE